MPDFKVGDRVVAVKDGVRFGEGGPLFKKGDTGTIVELDGNIPNIQFDQGADGFCDDGLWWASRDKIKHIEPRKAIAQDEIRRRMEKIRKHLAKIADLIAEDEQVQEEGQEEEKKESPWYPPEDPEFGPWVEYDGSGQPELPNGVETEVLVREERVSKESDRGVQLLCDWDWSWCDSRCYHERQIVAYRVKK